MQPALQNLLQRVGRFFHLRSSCPTHICGRLRWTKITRKANYVAEYIELFGSFTRDVMHDDAYIGGRSENNIKCVVHNDLG